MVVQAKSENCNIIFSLTRPSQFLGLTVSNVGPRRRAGPGQLLGLAPVWDNSADVESLPLSFKPAKVIITFRVSRRPREMYCGHARLCVCLRVCPRPHAHIIARTRM